MVLSERVCGELLIPPESAIRHTQVQFPLFSRILHWTMAAMVLTMLFIGIGMVASLSDYHRLVAIHKPLGILILILVAVRLVNRLLNPPPPLPSTTPEIERLAINAR